MSKRSYTQIYWDIRLRGAQGEMVRSTIHLYRQRQGGAAIPTGAKTLCGTIIPANAHHTRTKVKGIPCQTCMDRKNMKSNPLANPVQGAWNPTRAEIVTAMAYFARSGGIVKRLPDVEISRSNVAMCTQFHGTPVGFSEFAWE